MSKLSTRAAILGCAALPVGLAVLTLGALGWLYLGVPVDESRGHDGASIGTAMIVEAQNEFDAIDAESTWLLTRRPADRIVLQSLMLDGDRAYDVFEMQTPNGETYRLHFDITDAYGRW
jgi:hypothetical protein